MFVPAETVTVWSGAVLAILMLPVAFVTEMPVPAVRPASVYPAPSPIKSWPLVGVVPRPVPPALIASVPPSDRVPADVIGPPETVSPVVPPEPSTLVTVPAPATAPQTKLLPLHLRKVSA